VDTTPLKLKCLASPSKPPGLHISAASRHDHDGRDRDFWSGMTEILVSDGSVFWR
jgi:hypothetical protein